MEIRQAYQNEAQEIAPLVHEAVGDIADELANSQDKRKVRDLLANLIKREGTRVGHTFIDVVEVNGVIGGIAVSYSGKVLEAANKPTFGFLRRYHDGTPKAIQKNVLPLLQAKEAEEDEYYLDALAVDPKFRGQGLGTALIKHVQKKARKKGFSKASLLVEHGNIGAYRLYKKIGYKVAGKVSMKDMLFTKLIKTL